MPVSVVVSSFGAGNGSCFTSGRLSFAAARENHLPDILAFIHVSKYTPSPALIFNAILSVLYVIPSEVESLIDFFSLTAWLFYGLTMLALIRLRYIQPWKDKHRPYRVHLSIPILVFIISIIFVVAPVMEKPQIEYLYVLLYLLSGFLAYLLFVKWRVRIRSLGRYREAFSRHSRSATKTDCYPIHRHRLWPTKQKTLSRSSASFCSQLRPATRVHFLIET